MTLQEFWLKLQEAGKRFRPTIEDKEIRLRGPFGVKMCPLTAVCFMETGKWYAIEEWGLAYGKLTPKDADTIVVVADRQKFDCRFNWDMRHVMEALLGLNQEQGV